MADYSQSNRWLKVKTPFPDDVLLLESFRGREALSELFEFSLELLALNETKIPFDHILGKPITVEMEQEEGPPRFFDGIVRELRRGRSGSIFTNYRATVVPSVWKLSRRIQSRIFQNQTAIEILRTVFDGYDVEFKIRQRHFPHNYCVQYDESDFAFASRLMEEEGIYYYFVHAIDGESRQPKHKLVIADESSLAPSAPGEPIRFDSVGGGVRPKARIHDWEVVQQLCTRRHELRGRHFESFTSRLAAQSATLPSVTVGGSELRLHVSDDDMTAAGVASGVIHRFDALNSNGGNQQDRFSELYPALEQEAKLRAEEASADAVRIEGAGACSHLAPGMRLTLAGRGIDDGDYLMTSIEHEAAAPSYRSGDENAPAEKYFNRFTAIPAALPFRPKRRISAPRIDGVQSAIVVGPAGQEIHTDAYGRIKVCFQWDQQQKCDGSDTCWVRVASQWAGQGYGMISLPRIGQEVVVAFEDGDPDAPLVVGSVYNNNQTTPFGLPDDLTKMCIKSKTVGGDSDQFHGLLFDDKKSSELVHIRSQKDAIFDCKNNHGTYVPNLKTTRVGNCRLQLTGGLPLGSGSGSGGESGAVLAADEGAVATVSAGNDILGSGVGGDAGAWSVQSTDPSSLLSLNLSSTFGMQAQSVLGASVETSLLSKGSYLFDPVGAATVVTSSFPTITKVCRTISGVTGDVEIAYGSTFNATYGPAYSIQRGGDVFQNEGELTTIQKVGLAIFAGLHSAALFANTFTAVAAQWMDDDGAKTYSWVTSLATHLLGIAVVKYEQLYCLAADATARSKFASDILEIYKNQALANNGVAIANFAKGQATAVLQEGSTEGKYTTHNVAGEYQLTARDAMTIKNEGATADLTITGQEKNLIINTLADSSTISIQRGDLAKIVLTDRSITADAYSDGVTEGKVSVFVGEPANGARGNGALFELTHTSTSSKITLKTNCGGQGTGASITLDGANVTIAAGTNGTVSIKSHGDNGGLIRLSDALAELAAGNNKGDKLSIDNENGGLTFTSTAAITATAATDMNITTNGGSATFSCSNGTNFT